MVFNKSPIAAVSVNFHMSMLPVTYTRDVVVLDLRMDC